MKITQNSRYNIDIWAEDKYHKSLVWIESKGNFDLNLISWDATERVENNEIKSGRSDIDEDRIKVEFHLSVG